MKIRWHVCLILVLCSAASASAQGKKEKNPDHSLRGGEYAILNNLLMPDIREVEYVGRAQVEVYGKVYEASKFRLPDVSVRVTLSGSIDCHPDNAPLQPCEATTSAEIEILVGRDETGEIHDEMLRRVRAYWAANRPGRGKDAKTEEHLNYQDGEYFMFRETRSVRDSSWRAKRLFWVDGKFVKLNLKRYFPLEKKNDIGESPISKDEGLDHFVTKGLYLRPRAARMRAKRMKGAFREEFLSLYDRGVFGRPAPHQNAAGGGEKYLPELPNLTE